MFWFNDPSVSLYRGYRIVEKDGEALVVKGDEVIHKADNIAAALDFIDEKEGAIDLVDEGKND